MIDNKYPDLNKIKKSYETHKNKFTLSYGSDIDEMIPYMIQSYMQIEENEKMSQKNLSKD